MSEINNRYIEYYLKKQIDIDTVLSVPEDGWTNFRIGESEYELSYLTDLPEMWLDTMISNFKKPYVLTCECEPGELACVVMQGTEYVHLFFDDRYQTSYIVKKDFTTIIMNDIDQNLDAWVEWVNGYWCWKKEPVEIKRGLQERINRLKYLYEEDERKSREFRQKIEEENIRIEEERKRQEELEMARESGDPDSIDIMDPGEDHDQQERKE